MNQELAIRLRFLVEGGSCISRLIPMNFVPFEFFDSTGPTNLGSTALVSRQTANW